MNFSTVRSSSVAPFALFSIALLSACGASSGNNSTDAGPAKKQGTATSLRDGSSDSLTLPNTTVLPNGGILQPPPQTSNPPPAQPSGPTAQTFPGTQTPTQGNSGSPGIQVGIRFPKKIVGKPLEYIDLKAQNLADAQPVLTEGVKVRGYFIPAGTHVTGTVQMISGRTSTFQAERFQLTDGSSLALQGGGYVLSADQKLSSANVTNIALGALIGAGLATLIDHFTGATQVNPWVVVGGAVAGGIVGWQVFPSETDVIAIEKETLASIGVN